MTEPNSFDNISANLQYTLQLVGVLPKPEVSPAEADHPPLVEVASDPIVRKRPRREVDDKSKKNRKKNENRSAWDNLFLLADVAKEILQQKEAKFESIIERCKFSN